MRNHEHGLGRPARAALIACGVALTALGTAGVLLPLLPTTPFLLAASACFVRSSPRLHGRLLASRAFGPYLAQWERDRTVPREAKRKAYLLIGATFGVSLWLVEGALPRAALVAIGIALIGFLAWLPTTREPAAEPAPPRGAGRSARHRSTRLHPRSHNSAPAGTLRTPPSSMTRQGSPPGPAFAKHQQKPS